MDTVTVFKNIWWPFGSHLLNTKYVFIDAQRNGHHFFYKYNTFPAFIDGTIEHYFESMSTCSEDELAGLTQLTDLPANCSIPNEHRAWFDPRECASVEEYHSRVLRHLYKPNARVQSVINGNRMLEAARMPYIGLHIRLSDKVCGPDKETEPIDVDTYMDACVRLQKKHGINTLVVCCDTTNALEEVQRANAKRGLGFNVLWNEDEVRCHNNWEQSVVHKGRTGALTPAEFEREYMTCFVNIELLLRANFIVGNFDSCFILVAAEMRNNPEDVNVTGRTPMFGIHLQPTPK